MTTIFYSNGIMQTSQQLNKPGIFFKASSRQRLVAALVCLVVIALFGLLWLAGAGTIDPDRWLNPCGFKQKYNLTCPTCGITTSAIAFAQGKIITSFYIQPAGALLCSVLAVSAFLAFTIAVLGVYFHFLERFFREIKIKYIILALIVIIAAGWAVTLARALAVKNQG